MSDPTSDSTPQFATAEYSGKPLELTCKSCTQKISGSFYRVNQAPTCPACAQRLQQEMPRDSGAAFVRGLVFGVGAAIVGFGLYVAVALTTGLVSGFVSLAVGFLVGKAIVFGSSGVGGRRYQIAALVLTYMAVSLAAVPISLSVHAKHQAAQQQAAVSDQSATAAKAPPAAPAPRMGLASALGVLTLIGLASPFLALADPIHGVIGLIILMVGIQIAWRLTAARRLDISGPIAPDDRAPAVAG